MTPTPLSNSQWRDPLGDPSMATSLTYVHSREFRGWACNKCDWRFPVSRNLVSTDRAEDVVTLFDEHHCSDRAKFDEFVRTTVKNGGCPVDKASVIADWVVPLMLWIAMIGIFASLVVAALSTAVG